ncbi:hypothetical protein AVEN_58990-1 [Araneus ventricosus]|uniref:Uncharacterized protein n=1 Tax=Araneus ventricosus TaxID=182803 RepID=A0A4Y2K9Z9_ARAVE|nr:hypothetical protein AVEN_58990-1 [Araneus ventricosus]
MFGRSLLEVCLPSWDRKEACCSRVCGMARTFRRNVSKCSDVKRSESSDGDLSDVLTGCCRLCMRRVNGVAIKGYIRRAAYCHYVSLSVYTMVMPLARSLSSRDRSDKISEFVNCIQST